MDPLSATQDAIQILQYVYGKYQEYRDADKTIADAKSCLEAVEVRLDLFKECLQHTQSDLTDRQRKVLQNSLDKVSDVLTQLGEKLPEKVSIGKIITIWDKDTQGTFFMLDLVGRLRVAGVKDADEMRKRLFDTGDRTFAGAWTLSNRIHSYDTSDPQHDIPHLPKSSIVLPSQTRDQMLGQYQDKTLYLEAHYIEEGDEKHKQSQINSYERLAYVFQNSGVDLSLLHLLASSGLVEDYDFDRCYIAYDIPFPLSSIHKVPTLSHALEQQIRISLEDRFRIALEATVAVFSVHAAGWVHKNIRSDSILIDIQADDKDSKAAAAVGTAYLVGFQATRPRVEGSDQRPEMDPVKRLYQHPERQGGRDTRVTKFDIRHDMYSLGAVLIEIGYRKTLQEMFKVKSSQKPPALDEAKGTHQNLVKYAHRLTDKMGTKYADATLVCLTKTTVAGVSSDRLREEFYESVLLPLRQIYEGLRVVQES